MRSALLQWSHDLMAVDASVSCSRDVLDATLQRSHDLMAVNARPLHRLETLGQPASTERRPDGRRCESDTSCSISARELQRSHDLWPWMRWWNGADRCFGGDASTEPRPDGRG